MASKVYQLRLFKTYYEKGFFNIGVSSESLIRPDNGRITIQLEGTRESLVGKVKRDVNNNGTPRVFGRAALRDWFQRNFNIHDTVEVVILSPNEIRIRKSRKIE